MAELKAQVTPIKAAPVPEGSQAFRLAERLLQIEADVRGLSQDSELAYHIVNETRRLVAFRQAFLVASPVAPKVKTISSVSVVDRNAPLVRWIESVVKALVKDVGADRVTEFTLPAYGEADASQSADYPFPCLLYVPLSDRSGKAFSGLLLAREQPWREPEVAIAKRLGETYAHAWLALSGGSVPGARSRTWMRRFWPVALAAMIGVGVVPVPLTTLAPAEVVADGSDVITSPIRGVIEKIEVPPNALVEEGQVLFRIVDTELRNEFELAEQAFLVAEATVRTAMQTSFVDPRAKRDLAVAEAELELAEAKREYARELLSQTVVRSKTAGLAIYGDADDWGGRPVTVGERVMEIADPSQVKISVEQAVDDAIALSDNARVRVFLDADPLNAIEAKLTSAAFHAEPTPDGNLAYRANVRIADGTTPRIGLRGTAQLYGETVPLYFYLFRRPISAVRQSLGL